MTRSGKTMMFKIDNNLPLNVELKRILLELHDDSLDRLNSIEQDPDPAVHEFRKNMKKIRAVLRLIRSNIETEIYQELNALSRNFSRHFASTREGKVFYDTIGQLITKYKLPKVILSIRGKLFDRYNEAIEKIKTDRKNQLSISESLQSSSPIIETLTLPQDSLELIKKGLKKVYAQGFSAFHEAGKKNDAPHFHEWRKKVKHLWYQCMLLNDFCPATFNEYIADLDSLSDYLGKEHDLAELKNLIINDAEMQSIPPKKQEKIIIAIDAERTNIQHKSLKSGARIYRERPKNFIKEITDSADKKYY
jgi:CHAD domain-containing protein